MYFADTDMDSRYYSVILFSVTAVDDNLTMKIAFMTPIVHAFPSASSILLLMATYMSSVRHAKSLCLSLSCGIADVMEKIM